MPFAQFDRSELTIRPLATRASKLRVERDFVAPEARPRALSSATEQTLRETVERVRAARGAGRPVILAFGAHTIKNGLAPVLSRLMEQGWVTHLATNGAAVIHDWEFAFQGASSEDVAGGVRQGQFGIWEETGRYINLAINIGAWAGLGYGESVGAMIQQEGVHIPSPEALKACVGENLDVDPGASAAAADLLGVIRRFGLQPGFLRIPHPFKQFSLQAAAYRLRVPFTSHPMFGHDIIYTHPMNHGAAIGRAAERDFLAFAANVGRLEGGVYLSVGSAVMSPMIFEKSLSMARNIELQKGCGIDRHFIVVVDLAEGAWDWKKDGEPPQSHPAYYLRYCKTFSRMGGELRYASSDNRDFLLTLCQRLAGTP